MENGKNQHSLSFKASLEEKDKTRQAGPLSIYTVHRPIQLRVGYGLCVECIYVFSSPNESGQTNRADNMRGGYLRRPGDLWRKALIRPRRHPPARV